MLKESLIVIITGKVTTVSLLVPTLIKMLIMIIKTKFVIKIISYIFNFFKTGFL